MVGFTFFVHTGRFLKRIFITRKMVGYKFGEFIRTRKYGKSKIRINNVNRLKKKV
jgi:ribosomal protein S19